MIRKGYQPGFIMKKRQLRQIPTLTNKVTIDDQYQLIVSSQLNSKYLSTFIDNCKVSPSALKQCAEMVESKNEIGSLHPLAHVCIFPQTWLLDQTVESIMIRQQFDDLFKANHQIIKDTQIIFDFDTYPIAISLSEALRSRFVKDTITHIYSNLPTKI